MKNFEFTNTFNELYEYHQISAENNKYTYIDFDNPTEIVKILDYGSVTYEDYDFPVKSLEQLLSKRQSHKTDLLSKMYFLFEKFFKYLDNEKTPILPLSTHKLAKYFTNIVASATFLRQLVSLGALAYKDATYHFGVAKNRCRTYYINIPVFKEAAKYCKAYNIKPYAKIETMAKPIENQKLIKKIKLGRVHISLKEANENQISQVLLEKYPFIRELKKEIQKNNQRIESPFFWDTCDFGFKYNKQHTHVTGIGFRVSNSLCNKSKEERAEILNELGIQNNDDVSASVLSINRSLNQGYWREPCDMYEEVYKNIHPEGFDSYEFKTKQRKIIKALAFRPIFGESEADIFSKLNFGCNHIIKEDEKIVREEIHILKEGIEKTIGASWKSTLFAVESYVMFKIKKELMDSGLEVYQVYDCLYHNGKINLEALLEKHFNTFYEKYEEWALKNKPQLKNTGNFTKVTGLKNTQIPSKEESCKSSENNTTVLDSNTSNGLENPSKPKVLIDSQTAVIDSSFHSESKQLIDNRLNFKFSKFNISNISNILKFKNLKLKGLSNHISPLYKVSKNQSKKGTRSTENTRNSMEVSGSNPKGYGNILPISKSKISSNIQIPNSSQKFPQVNQKLQKS